MPAKLLPILLGCLLSACANTVDDYGNSVVAGVTRVSDAIDYQLSSPTRLQVPFNAGIKGNLQEKQVDVVVGRDYALTLRLHFEEGGAPAEARVVRVAGSQPGAPPRPGLPIPVHVRVGRIQGTFLTPVYDTMSSAPILDGYGRGFYTYGLGVVHLTPGLYQVTVEALQDVPALSDVPITFNIGPAPIRSAAR